MQLVLDFSVVGDEGPVRSVALAKNLEVASSCCKEPMACSGAIIVTADGEELCGEFEEPIFRLAGEWARKAAWILGGDTETLPLRNSEQCFAFLPTGQSVELSFFEGTESEIEDYIVEPFTVLLANFMEETIAMVERMVALVRTTDASLLETDEDCRDLLMSLDELKNAWREHQLHERR